MSTLSLLFFMLNIPNSQLFEIPSPLPFLWLFLALFPVLQHFFFYYGDQNWSVFQVWFNQLNIQCTITC